MQLKNLFLAASAAATVSALPTAQAENASEKTFGIVSIHSGSAVQYASFNATGIQQHPLPARRGRFR